MGGMKKPKKPKKAKLPKEAIKEKPSKEEKKLKKEIIKQEKILNKKINRGLSICAVLLCLAISILDIVQRNKSLKD